MSSTASRNPSPVTEGAVKTGFAWYVENIAGYELMYGALAAFPVFLMWIFLFWMIVLAGAAVTAALTDGGGKNRA